MTTTATKGTEGNSNKKKPLNPITIVWYTHYIPDTQTSYYAIDAVVTLRETKEVKQFSLTAKTREELLVKLFKKLQPKRRVQTGLIGGSDYQWKLKNYPIES